MREVEIVVDGGRTALISPLLFGGLIEHLGDTIYGGVWDESRNAPRADVLAAIKALGINVLRWPGGCFSAWYRWEDGIGPREQRPRHERTCWTDMSMMMGPEVAARMGRPEHNAFGTDEFLQYCLDINCEPLLVANLGGGQPEGAGTPEEAARWVRYCNIDRRSPRPVRWWAVGNETWGGHELGHCTAEEYAARFRLFAEHMRAEDPTLRLIAAGVCPDQYGLGAAGMWDDWNRTVVRDAGDQFDLLSLHWYFPGMLGRKLGQDDADHLQVSTGADDLERLLAEAIADVDTTPGGDRIQFALDEWGQMAAFEDHLSVSHRLIDAVYFAGCWNALLRHADRVSMAMIAGLVNVLAPIQTDGDRHFVTAAYLVGRLYKEETRAFSLGTTVRGPELTVPAMEGLDGALMIATMARNERTSPMVDASASTGGDSTAVFVSNRSLDESAEVTIRGIGSVSDASMRIVSGPDRNAANDVDHPTVLGYAHLPVHIGDGHVRVEVPPSTAGAVRLHGTSL